MDSSLSNPFKNLPFNAPQMAQPNTKLAYLNSVECHEQAEAEPDENRKKYFVTFPYPYMNGKLHLGHLYSISKSDFVAYYKRLQGYNVLFPFAFHCTGMPISASAHKLSQELSGNPVDVSVIGILKSLGIDDPRPFKDPLHWIHTFPALAVETLKQYHSCIDWRRSFITTDINPYYDSFVSYQFNRLRSLGFISFGKRYSIFCTIDNQACLDHDRRKGEGIKPKELMLRKVPLEGASLLVRVTSPLQLSKAVLPSSLLLQKFCISSQVFISEESVYENIRHQVSGCEDLGTCSATELVSSTRLELADALHSPKAVYEQSEIPQDLEDEYMELYNRKNEEPKLVESNLFVKIYEPEGLVISRAGSKCVVSLLDQWFIDYSNEAWKERVRACLSQMEMSSDTRQKLDDAVSWINKWGVSRSFGLGTRIPWDPQYLIDSLSDSTIYMVFYTVKHLLFRDLEGADQLFPSSELCPEVWAYIFEGAPLPESLAIHKDLLKKCQESFNYFYPVDLRVSGKDLIANHLTFFLFNHVALFPEHMWPRRIFTNGHVMLNSAKMSKSEGNFLSAEDALERYGTSATRMCLASCGDTNEDANFEEGVANGFVLKLYTLVKAVEDIPAYSSADLLLSNMPCLAEEDRVGKFANTALIQLLSSNIRATIEAYDSMTFRDVVKFAFYESLYLVELYQSLGGKSKQLVSLAYKTILQLIYPLVPSLSLYLLRLKFDGELSLPKPFTEDTDHLRAVDYLRELCAKITGVKKDRTVLTVVVGQEYAPWRKECMSAVDEVRDKGDLKTVKLLIVKKISEIALKYKLKKNSAMLFGMDYLLHRPRYLLDFDEFSVLSLNVPYIEQITALRVHVVLGDGAEPKMPLLQFD